MTYPVISAQRIPYDLDGTTVGYRTLAGQSLSVLFGQGIATNLTGANLTNFNKENRSITIGATASHYPQWGVWFIFPELRNITRIGMVFPSSPINDPVTESAIQGSADTTNGVDGTWENATYTLPTSNITDADNWRDNTFTVTFTQPIKAIRIGQYNDGWTKNMNVNAIHLYGTKATGQTANDLIFTDIAGTELTALKDWGNRAEWSTANSTFKVKNVSTDTICTSITITSPDTSLTMSWSESTGYTDALTIASLGAESLSDTIYVRHTLGQPPLTLGAVAARIYMTGTWS